MTSVYLVEDHPLFQHALSAYLNRVATISVCGTASSGQEALTEIPKLTPDIVLVDISLPDINGLDVVEELYFWCPQLPTLILSSYRENMYVEQALAVGARGFIVKGNPLEVEQGIRHVLAGGIYLSPSCVLAGEN